MAQVKTVRFPLRPSVFCPECNYVLTYDKIGLKSIVEHRSDNGCRLAGKKFRSPSVTLEEVVTDGKR